jgi:hypothetical protein
MLVRRQRKESHGGRPIQAMVRVGGVTERLSFFVPKEAISRFFVFGHVLFVSLHGRDRFRFKRGSKSGAAAPWMVESAKHDCEIVGKLEFRSRQQIGRRRRTMLVGGVLDREK